MGQDITILTFSVDNAHNTNDIIKTAILMLNKKANNQNEKGKKK